MTDLPPQPWSRPEQASAPQPQPDRDPRHGRPWSTPAPQAYGQPGSERQQQPAYGQPQYGQPTYGQPAYGQPQHSPYTPSAYGPGAPQQPYAPYGQPGFAPQPAPPTKPALLPAALPVDGQSYPMAFAPLERRVGRWFVAWAIAIGFFFGGQVVSLALLMPGMVEFFSQLDVASASDPDVAAEMLGDILGTPLGMAGVNMAWAAMIPGAIVAMAAFGKGAAGFASSVAGRWRWRTTGRAAIVILPIFAVYIGISLWLDPSVEWQWNPNWGLVAIVLLTTPLQATGEEFTFRGLLPQLMGGWLRHRYVPALVLLLPVLAVMVLQPATWYLSLLALVAAAVGPWVLRGRLGNAIWIGIATGLLFGAMHAHPSISATLQLSLVGFTCSMLTYRTGGLESASVLHTANNVFIMVPLALTGTSAFSSQPVAGEDWLSFGLTTLALAAAYLAVHFFLAKEQRSTVGAPGAELLEPRAPLAEPMPEPVGAR